MRVLGVDVPREPPGEGATTRFTLVMLGADGRVSQTERLPSIAALATQVGEWCGGEPFAAGVNTPVVVPAKAARARPVENLARRRFGVRLPPGGRTALSAEPHGVVGETLLAALAAAGQPCLPYPDRNRRERCLAETHPGLILKTLLWEASPLASVSRSDLPVLFRAYPVPGYRESSAPKKSDWATRSASIDLTLRALGPCEGFDFEPARDALERARSESEVEQAAALLDASLIAGAVRRYLEAPERSLFLGDVEGGYVILPADALVRRLAVSDRSKPREGLFPRDSLKQRLGQVARLRPVDLLTVPGRPQRTEAGFTDPPSYEFDNVDEMLWWKHCRHLAGAKLPTEGLTEMHVSLGAAETGDSPLRLVRSRHRTLSFRFEPPASWRTRLPTRDGKTYPFHILRAVYDTLAPAEI